MAKIGLDILNEFPLYLFRFMCICLSDVIFLDNFMKRIYREVQLIGLGHLICITYSTQVNQNYLGKIYCFSYQEPL